MKSVWTMFLRRVARLLQFSSRLRRMRRRLAFRNRLAKLVLRPCEERVVPATVTWINPTSGDWNTAANWFDGTTNRVPATGDDVVIPDIGNNGVDLTVTIDTVSPTINSLSVAENVLITNQKTLTVSGTAGITDNGTVAIGDANLNSSSGKGTLLLSANETISGSGVIVFGLYSGNTLHAGSSSTITVGPNITIHGASGTIGTGSANSKLINHGTISADVSGGELDVYFAYSTGTSGTNSGHLNALNGGTLAIKQIAGIGWTNTGTITETNSSLELGGTFTLDDLGTLNRTGGTINLTGTMAPGANYDARLLGNYGKLESQGRHDPGLHDHERCQRQHARRH